MTSGTDEPRPAGGQPAGADPRPEPGQFSPGASEPAHPPTPDVTQPWRAQDDEPQSGSPAEADRAPAAEPIRPLPGGGWVYAGHEPRQGSGQSGTASGAGPGAGSEPPAQPARPAPVTPRPSYGAGGAAGAPLAARTQATARPAPTVRKGPRRARLTVKRVDPWSTLKFSFVYSLAGVVVLLVAAAVLYLVVDAMGVIDSVRTFLNDIEGGSSGLSKWLGFGRVMTIAVVIGVVNVVLFTAFATLTAFVYNVCTEIVGGIELTLADTATGASAEVASSGGKGL